MFKLKTTAVAVLALGSSAVFAGTMGPVCTPGNVTVPCENTAFDVGAQLLYLQPTYTGAFAYVEDILTNSTNYNDFDFDYEFGFRLEGSYHFATGNDLTINWLYWSHDYDNTFNNTRYGFEPKFNQVNVEMGQHVDFGEMKNIRFHGGVQYVMIEHDATINNVHVANLKYNGFGPRGGMDMSYDFGNGFAIYGNSAASLTVGDNEFNVTGVGRGSHTRVVPSLEAKLGAKYSYAMATGDLTLDAGYLWLNYFNAQHIGPFDTDFALNGPYIGLKYVGNV